MTRVLFAAEDDAWAQWEPHLRSAFVDADLEVDLVAEADPETVDYIIYAPTGGLEDFTPFTRAKAVLSLWAGVERIVTNPTLTQPIARMVDPGLAEAMTEYVTAHVLRHHLGIDRDICRRDAVWDYREPPLARDRRVTVLGLGALGAEAARALSALNFDVAGWSRSAKSLSGIETFSGEAGLLPALRRADILVLLLPLTAATENLIDARHLAALPRGAVIVNPGRGALIDDEALLDALDSAHVGHATLDVFRTEPLPVDHRFWAHPRVTVTPHLASATRPATAAHAIAENIRRGEAGEPFLNLVDRTAGY